MSVVRASRPAYGQHLSMRSEGARQRVLMLRCPAGRGLEARTALPASRPRSFREPLNHRPIPADQRLFLGPDPALDPSLRIDGVRDPAELLSEHQLDRPSRAGVAWLLPALMLADPLVQTFAAGGAYVVAAIRAAQDIDERAHGVVRPSRPLAGHLRMRNVGRKSISLTPLMLRCPARGLEARTAPAAKTR